MASKNPGGRPSKDQIDSRRKDVKEMMLQEVSHAEMARRLGVTVKTIQGDIAYWQNYYSKLAVKHPSLAREQLARVNKVLDEIEIVKREYWAAYQDLMEKLEENKQIMKQWQENVQRTKQEYEQAVANNDGKEKRRLTRLIQDISKPPRLPSYYSTRLDTLKSILDRIDKEAKLLNLFNPASQIQSNMITMDTFKSVMLVFKNIIMDMIPEEQRRYAFERLRRVKIHDIQATDIVEDAQIVKETSKVSFNKAELPKETIETPTPEESESETSIDTEDGDPEDLTDLEI